ncbi:ligand-binding sensor domain-containing diguanylate cyclase [Rheinheimera maricola]|uniref:diguanylate cyclase n=1 Tax=Rheinheimera maricola TaxID=2793282 RepID=A0ABS7X6M4_9GAMM|nr:ligand-binding sensor domain-containing diguanylate cyclase [Rheinheimera maricola]MBZ9611198.1 diguanylate cyclase [Rheinheimera maricola]
MHWIINWRCTVSCSSYLMLYPALFTLMLITSIDATAEPAIKLSNYFQESWTTRDGLPHNTINSINQSDDGYLWVATWEGLARFNGRNFALKGRGTDTGLPDSGVRAIHQDNDGALLVVGSRGGFVRRSTTGWRHWPQLNVLLNDVKQDQHGGYWLASEGQGLFYQQADGSRLHFTSEQGLPSDIVHSLLVDPAGRVWIGSGRGLAVIYPDTPTTIHTIPDIPPVPVFALLQRDDTVLVGTERGLYQWQNGQSHLVQPELSEQPVSALLLRNNELWLGTTDRGLLRLTDGVLEQLTIDGGLPNNRILSLYQDRENSIWVGTNGGLFRLREAPFVTYTAERGLAGDYTRAVLAHSDGSIWVGSSQGLSRIVGQTIERLDISAYSRGQSVLSLSETADGSVWIGTYTDGALLWRDGKIVQKLQRDNGLLANEVRAVLPLTDGVWVGTAQGLNFVTKDATKAYGTEHGLPALFIMALYQHSDGRLFIGTGGGVAIMQTDGSITALDFSALDGAEYAFGFTPDPQQNLLWMTTDRGLVAYHFADGRLSMLGRKVGLPFDKLFQAVLDVNHNLWISSNRGILRLERDNLAGVLSGLQQELHYELFGESDGMQSAQANGGSMAAATLAQDGTVWFATSKGVSWVQPGILRRFATHIPPVVIEGLRVNGAEAVLRQGIVIAPGANRLEFAFAGLGFVMPQRIQYRSQLVGFDEDWIDRGSHNTAEYTNLPPGDYQLRVAAAYPQGGWSRQEAHVNFTILPYYWQRVDFWLAIMATIILLALAMLRWRFNALQRSEQLLRLQVAEKTLKLQQQADHLQAIDQERSALLTQIKQQAQEFEQQARLDALTGLPNRRAFDEALARECARSKRSNLPLCLVLMDIDHFKQVNDRYSHSIGDEVLKLVAAEISTQCRQDDTVSRWGGEEFALLLPNTDIVVAQDICERIRKAVMQIDCSAFAAGLHISISLGVAQFAGEVPHDKLLSRSDSALYQAKQSGRNRVDVAL